jgi:hypothetical protein
LYGEKNRSQLSRVRGSTIATSYPSYGMADWGG